jgi:hypothetical protein
VTVGGPGLVAVGSTSGGLSGGAAVWVSDDGTSWVRVADDGGVFGGEAGLHMASVTPWGNGLVAVGGGARSGPTEAGTWEVLPEVEHLRSDAAVWYWPSDHPVPPTVPTTMPEDLHQESVTTAVGTVLLPAVPQPTTGWRLEPGDVLVANADGVHLVRDGELVGTLVTSPTEVAVADGSGAITLQMPDPYLWPDNWPDRYSSGGLTLWRVDPEGAADAVYNAADAASGVNGALRLYDVAVVAPLSPARAGRPA